MRLGAYVCATHGRDANKCFLVVGIIDEAYVIISDGKSRKLEKPKKKKIKHLVPLSDGSKEITEKLLSEVPLTNKEIRKALNELNASKGEE